MDGLKDRQMGGWKEKPFLGLLPAINSFKDYSNWLVSLKKVVLRFNKKAHNGIFLKYISSK
jgi:hypothetical protein